jgi:hypothetical protein
MPKLDFAFLADAAEAEPGRKFYVLGGGIDNITGAGFPLIHPHMSLVMRWIIHPAELDHPHHLEVRLGDADGKELARIEGDIEASGSSASPGREASVNMVINMAQMRFETPGDFSIEILMNNQHQKSLALHVGSPPTS